MNTNTTALTNRIIIAFVAFAIFVVATMIGRSLRGQITEYDFSRPNIQQSGQLFTVRYSPTSSTVDVLTVGLPVMKLDPSRVEVFGRQIDLNGARRDFSLRWSNGYYQVAEPVDSTLKMEIEVIDKGSNKSEVFELDPRD